MTIIERIEVNEAGKNEIRAAWAQACGWNLTTDGLFSACSVVENNWAAGNLPYFEIAARYTKRGNPVVIHITDEGYDVIDDDDRDDAVESRAAG